MIVRKIVGAVLALVLLAQLQGCGTYRWTEDVELSDGRVITVQRTQTYGGGGGIGSSCGACVLESTRVRFELDGKAYDWRNSKSGYSFTPMILDVVDGMPVLVATPHGGHCAKDPDNPNKYYLYTYNRWAGDGWLETNQFEGKITTRRNLLEAPRRKHAPLAEKNEILRVLRVQPQYREIVDDGKLRPNGCNGWR